MARLKRNHSRAIGQLNVFGRRLSELLCNPDLTVLSFPTQRYSLSSGNRKQTFLLTKKKIEVTLILETVYTIDFSINRLCAENRLGSQRTPNTVENKSKLIVFVIRIELTRTYIMPRFSNFLRNAIINFRMFLHLLTCFLRVSVSLLCRLHDVSMSHVSIYPYLISEGKRNCSTWDRYSNETATLWKHVTKYENMQTLIFEFLKKLENRVFKIARVNSILITNSINLF